MGGSPVDNNAKLFRAGQMKVLKPYIDEGKIKIVGDQWVDGWLPENALKIMENALTANNNKIDAVVASNDATAGGAIQALRPGAGRQSRHFRSGCRPRWREAHYRRHPDHDRL
jgi:D-xylose transport system substrate-binding protein